MDTERVKFGSHLREGREARALTLGEVARVTKIPERSLERLEDGKFDELPGDVFVRGFLRSYARAVGMDADRTLRQYGELISAERPVPLASLSGSPSTSTSTNTNTSTSTSTSPLPPRVDDTGGMSTLSKAILDATSRGTRKASLTLAVIILVIVATLTLSLLLSRPSHVGDGVSSHEINRRS